MSLYRKNAGIVVFNKDKQVLIFKRAKADFGEWQFPQGGIDEGETALDTAKRELFEETGIKSATPVKTLQEPLYYTFPPDTNGWWKKQGIEYIGQEQYWSLFYFTGPESEIKLDVEELVDFKWIDIKEAPAMTWEKKKEVYEKVVAEFEPVIMRHKG